MKIAPHVAYRIGQLSERIARIEAQRGALALEEQKTRAEIQQLAAGCGVPAQGAYSILTEGDLGVVGTVIDQATGQEYNPPAPPPAVALVPPPAPENAAPASEPGATG